MPSKREAALIVVAESPPSPGWSHTGRCVPHHAWITPIRRANWPTISVDVLLPQFEHRGVGAGQQTSDAVQPVTCVPRAWLERMAELMGTPWSEACRYEVPDEA